MSEHVNGDRAGPEASGGNVVRGSRSGKSAIPRFRSLGLLAVLLGLAMAALALRIGRPGAEPWLEGLRSDDPAERLAAVLEIEGAGRQNQEAAIVALLRALHDPDARVRAAAAKTTVSVVVPTAGVGLGPDHRNATISTLFGCLDDPDPMVRAEAAQALWMVILVAGAPPSKAEVGPIVTSLIDRLDDGDASVRLAAIRGLHNLGPKVADDPPAALLAAMDDVSGPVRLAAAAALAAYRKGLPRLLPSMVAAYDAGSPRYCEALRALVEKIHPPEFAAEALPGLVAAIQDRDTELMRRATANIALFQQNAGSAAPALAGRLNPLLDAPTTSPSAADQSIGETERLMVDSLGRVGPGATDRKAAVSALSKALRRDRDPKLRIAAAKALGRFPPDTEQFAVLSEFILDADPAVRHAVLWAIHDVDYSEGFVVPRSLATALEDPSAETRADAAAAIGHSGMGVDRFVPALVKHALSDNDQNVRGMCQTVINIVRPPKITRASVPHLLKGLDSPNPITRDVLCEALGRFRREAAPAIPALIGLLKEPSHVEADRYQRSAAVALGRIAPGTPQSDDAVEALTAFLQRELIHWTTERTIDALAGFGPGASAAVPRLRALQAHKEEDVRKAAAAALAKIRPAG